MLSLSCLDHRWLVVVFFVCFCNAQYDQNGMEEDDVEEGHGDGEGEDYWSTFRSVAGRVASSAGDSVMSAASSGANTISNMFTSEDNDDKDNKVCDGDGCVEEDTTSLETTGGLFNTVTTTMGNAWSNTAGAAIDGVKSTLSGQVDAVLGALGTRLATALTPRE